jgi:putative transposase
MWRDADRNAYRQAGDRLPSDLTDPEWERWVPLIPAAKRGGRPRKTDMRSAMNAILDLLRTGCPRRYLPRAVFPPRSTVYHIFRAFQRQGAWEAIWEELRAALRERLGREASPSAGVIDSCSLRSAEKILCGWTAARLGRLSFHTSMEATDAVRHLRDRCRDHRPSE